MGKYNLKKRILLCFMGIDGSGKTTLSKHLYKELKTKQYDVSYTWWLESENSFIRSLIRKMGKGKYSDNKTPINQSNKPTSKLLRIVYLLIVIIDYLRFGILKAGYLAFFTKGKILIYDRYYFDVLCALAREFNISDTWRDILLRLFGMFLPKPDLLIFIEIPLEIAFDRKRKDYETIENARVIWNHYSEVRNLFMKYISCKAVTIDNSQDIKKSSFEIYRNVGDIIK